MTRCFLNLFNRAISVAVCRLPDTPFLRGSGNLTTRSQFKVSQHSRKAPVPIQRRGSPMALKSLCVRGLASRIFLSALAIGILLRRLLIHTPCCQQRRPMNRDAVNLPREVTVA